MQSRRRRRLSQLSHTPRWLWGTGTALGLIALVVGAILVMHHRGGSNPAVVETSEPSAEVSESAPSTEPVVSFETTPEPEVPKLVFVAGSVEDACDFNEFPTYWLADGRYRSSRHDIQAKAIESNGECRAALDAHMSAVNPYHFLSDLPYNASLAEFVVLDEPFTFERIFANPADDLTRMQDALSRSECLLTGSETNWELRETCHADAFLNFALANVFCFDRGVQSRIKSTFYVKHRDNPAPELDRLLWKQEFEDKWVEQRCEGLDSSLELTAEHYPELYARVMSLQAPDTDKDPLELLVELAARLGDDAAGLAEGVRKWNVWDFNSEGYRYGRFSDVSESEDWWLHFTFKSEPQSDRFLQTFHMLARLSAWRFDPRDEIDFDWEFVARHLCEPPFFERTWSVIPSVVKNAEHLSCQEVIHEIRQQDIKFTPLLQALDKFEQVAIELDVYE